MSEKNIKKILSKAVTFFSVAALLAVSILTADAQNNTKVKLDFFGNKISDFAVLTFPQNGNDIRWRILKNENPAPAAPGAARIIDVPWGLLSDPAPASAIDSIPAFGDYSGNGVDSLNVYRFSSGSPSNSYAILPVKPNQQIPGNPIYIRWGLDTDSFGAEGDYDGDGKMDPTAIRETNGSLVWYVRRSSDNTFMTFNFGTTLFFASNTGTDIPLPGADYTGDGKDDPALVRIGGNGQVTWYVGTTSGMQISQTAWGNYNTDFIVPGGDYDGDGKADFMVWRGFGSDTNAVWYLRTNSGNISYTKFGLAADDDAARDIALRSGDYDGDKKTDIAVYRPSNLTFYVLKSTGGLTVQQWGIAANAGNEPIGRFGTY